MSTNEILGYNVYDILNTMLRDRPYAGDMKREFRAFLLTMAEKSSYRYAYPCCSVCYIQNGFILTLLLWKRWDGELFRRYVNHLVRSPKT